MTGTVAGPVVWGGLLAFVLGMLALDLGVFHRKAHQIKVREALIWSGVWIGLALLFNLGVFWKFGGQKAQEFFAGYLIEKSLSVDNLFVFALLFRSFAVPVAQQHRLLAWGVIGALVLRLIMVVAGAALLARFHWVTWVFGAILLISGLKLLREAEAPEDPARNKFVQLLRRVLPTTDGYRGGKFLVREQGRLLATPLLFALVVVEATDLVFALDSIPAVFAVSRDPFIVYSSNLFAILGLRSLYFALASMLDRFHYLRHGLALVLLFVGAKMILAGHLHIPTWVSLVVVAVLIGGAAVASVVVTRKEHRQGKPPGGPGGLLPPTPLSP